MNDVLYLFNLLAGLIIIPLTNWVKAKLPDLSFVPPLVALILATAFVLGIDWALGTHLDRKSLLMMIFGVQFISQLGHEGKKVFVGGGK